MPGVKRWSRNGTGEEAAHVSKTGDDGDGSEPKELEQGIVKQNHGEKATVVGGD